MCGSREIALNKTPALQAGGPEFNPGQSKRIYNLRAREAETGGPLGFSAQPPPATPGH